MLLWLTVAAALAGKPYTVHLAVVDEAGQPVTSAMVRFEAEGEQTHKVHGTTGQWANDGVDLPSGERVPFTKGQEVAFEVWADGYEKQRVEAVLEAKKRTELEVKLVAAPASEAPAEAEAPAEETEAPAEAPAEPAEAPEAP